MVSPVVGSLSAGGTGRKSVGASLANAFSFSGSVRALLASMSARASRLETVMGTSLELSAPPAMATACCPASRDSAALVMAWNEVAQARLTLNASMVFGIAVPSTISRAMFGALIDGTT